MARPIKTIDVAEAGILDNATIAASDGFNKIQGIDIYSDLGYLKAGLDSAEADATGASNITALITGFTKYDSKTLVGAQNNSRRIVYLDGSGWTAVDRTGAGTAVSNEGIADVAVFNGDLYYSLTQDLVGRLVGTLSGGTYTDNFGTYTDGTGNFHPMKEFGGKLYIADGRYVASIDTTPTFTGNALTLPAEFTVRSLEVLGDFLVVGCGTSSFTSGDPDITQVFLWNGNTTNDVTPLPVNIIGGAMAMKTVGNELFLLARRVSPPDPSGISIYRYNGANFDLVKNLINVDDYADASMVFANAIEEMNNNILIGTSYVTGDQPQLNGIWQYGRTDDRRPYSLTFKNKVSTAADLLDSEVTNTKIGAVKAMDVDLYYSFTDGSNFKVDRVGSNTRYNKSIVETQQYHIDDKFETLVRGIQLVGKPFPASTSISIDYNTNQTKVSGSATATTANKLVDSNANFTSDLLGMIVENRTDGTTATITAVDSTTTLSIDSDIMANTEDYVIEWTNLGTVTSSNQDQILYGINERANIIQVRLTYTISGATSPSISKILIW